MHDSKEIGSVDCSEMFSQYYSYLRELFTCIVVVWKQYGEYSMAAMFTTFYYYVLLTLIEINRDEWKTVHPIIVLREP